MSKYTTEGLYKAIGVYAKAQGKLMETGHNLACDVLEHAAETRDVRPLNRFHEVMLEAMKNNATALRVWIGKIQREHPEAAFLTFKSEGGFTVDKPSEAEGIMLTLIDGIRKGPSFYQRDVKREPDLLDDVTFARRVRSLLAGAEKGHVSSSLVGTLRNLKTAAEAAAEQLKAANKAAAAEAKSEAGVPVAEAA